MLGHNKNRHRVSKAHVIGTLINRRGKYNWRKLKHGKEDLTRNGKEGHITREESKTFPWACKSIMGNSQREVWLSLKENA